MARRINQESTGHGVNELNERKRRVLWAVVQDYADTAEPVGSRTIARSMTWAYRARQSEMRCRT